MRDGLPEECHVACVCASTKFEEICRRLEKGEVSLNELHRIKEKEKQVKRLCETVTGAGLSYDAVLSILKQRLNEYNYFSSRRHTYLGICNWISDPKYPRRIEGIDVI